MILQRVRRRLRLGRFEAPSIAPAFLEQAKLVDGIETPTIFDVGAHVGHITELYLRLFPTARVFAFEPAAEARKKLEEIAARNPGAKVFDTAVSDRKGVSVFYQNSFSPTNSLHPVDDRATRHWDGRLLTPSATSEVSTVALDEFCSEQGVNRIDVLKLDIQGGELAALRGTRRLLTEQAVGLVYLELLLVPTYRHQANLVDICCLLKEYDYEFHSAYDPCIHERRVNQLDAIFVSRRLKLEDRSGL